MGTSKSPASVHKSPRRKHKNSKLGCVQCKERRMKCDEELPECRNCHIRQVKIKCSYLPFSEEEKKIFLQKKAEQAIANQRDQALSSSLHSSGSSASLLKHQITTVKLVPHKRPEVLQSQSFKFIDETSSSFHSRLFLTGIINKSFFKFKTAFCANICFSAFWIQLQLRKKYQAKGIEDPQFEDTLDKLLRIAVTLKTETIASLRAMVLKFIDAQGSNNYELALDIFDQVSTPTIALQAYDTMSNRRQKHYYIAGTYSAMNEIYKGSNEGSPLSHFVGHAAMQLQRALFIPSYSHTVLEEISQVFGELKPHIAATEDEMLLWQYKQVAKFLNEDLNQGLLASKYRTNSITTYPAAWIYHITVTFYNLTPSETYTIYTCSSPAHKVFYSFIYMIGRALDNIFPEVRYVTQYRFIGPTCLYPYALSDLFDGLPSGLRELANYSTRLLVFFTRRYDLFNKYMKIKTPFPENLAENRLRSRKLKVNEVFISKFRETIIQPHHFPQVRGLPETSISLNSCTKDFNTRYILEFDTVRGSSLGSNESDTLSPRNLVHNLSNVASSGLLTCDFDPLKSLMVQDLGDAPYSRKDLLDYFEDHAVLMDTFYNDE